MREKESKTKIQVKKLMAWHGGTITEKQINNAIDGLIKKDVKS